MKESLILVCKRCGKIFKKPYWRVKQAIDKNMEVGFCSRDCYRQYRSKKCREIVKSYVKNLSNKEVKDFISKYHLWIVKMLKEKNGRYSEEIYGEITYELPRCIAIFKERNFGHKEILTYLAKIVSSKTIEYNKKTKNVKYYGNEVYLDYLTNENNEFTDIDVKI